MVIVFKKHISNSNTFISYIQKDIDLTYGIQKNIDLTHDITRVNGVAKLIRQPKMC